MERKCIKCIHFVCTREECSAENTEVCDLYETEVSRAIKKLGEEGYIEFERSKIGGNMIEAGEWIKTETGLIRRIKSIDKEEATENCPVDMYWCNLDKPIKILKECSKDTIYAIEMSDAKKLKHSKNIIDLIEVGDIVEIFDVLNEDVIYIWNEEMLKAVKEDVANGIKIRRILTKEQYEANCYKVKEE